MITFSVFAVLVICLVFIWGEIQEWRRLGGLRRENKRLRSNPCQHYQLEEADSLFTGTYCVRESQIRDGVCLLCGAKIRPVSVQPPDRQRVSRLYLLHRNDPTRRR